MFPYPYALEKFSQAVCSLATEPGDVRSRLLGIFVGPLQMITPEHLPPELQEEWLWIEKQTTKFDELWPGQRVHWAKRYPPADFRPPTRVEATLSRIKNRTGSQIANKVYDIWSSLNSRQRDWHSSDILKAPSKSSIP